MTTKMDAEPNDDPVTEGPAAADAPADAESTEDEDGDENEEFTHLDSLSDGAGCAEIWEHLSETRGGD